MKPLTRDDLKNIYEYEKVRGDARAAAIAHKQPRRIHVGPNVTFVFEDRITLTFQIQEMMRAERIVEDDKVQEEVDVYNQLLPSDGELSATMFIEIPDENELRRLMPLLPNVENSSYLDFGDGVRANGIAEGDRSREDRTASVHYLKFELSDNAWRRLSQAPVVKLVVDHRNYRHETALSPETRKSLAADRAG